MAREQLVMVEELREVEWENEMGHITEGCKEVWIFF